MVSLGVAVVRSALGRALLAALTLAILLAGPAAGAPEDRPPSPPGTVPVYTAQFLPVGGLVPARPHPDRLGAGGPHRRPCAGPRLRRLVACLQRPGPLYAPERGDGDLPANDGNPRIGATLAYATGHVVGAATGVHTTDFAAYLPTADASGTAFGPGLLDPAGAEVHLVLTDLGPVGSALDAYQLRSLAAGCGTGGKGDCPMTQFSVEVA